MDAFLEEQIRRIQALAERMSTLEHRAAELSSEIEKSRQQGRQGPLQDVRDFRICRGPQGRGQNQDSPQPRESRRRKRR
jgi:hypothetical protein